MAEKFLTRANGIHPDEALDSSAHDEMLARQNVLYECYMNSFGKNELIEFLYKAIANNFHTPEEVDDKIYRAAYVAQARQILKEVEPD